MVRPWLWVICLCFVIEAGGQRNVSESPPGPTFGPLELTPSKIDFGPQPVGTRSQPQTAILTNRSNQSVTIRDVTASGIDFTETDTCQGALAAGTRCAIDVTFTPPSTARDWERP